MTFVKERQAVQGYQGFTGVLVVLFFLSSKEG